MHPGTMNKRRTGHGYGVHTQRNAINGADPVELISMIFDGIISSIDQAQIHIAKGEQAAKSACIAKALNLITGGLVPNLNLEAGGEVAENMAALYDFCSNHLVIANANDDTNALSTVREIINNLYDPWKGLKARNEQTPS